MHKLCENLKEAGRTDGRGEGRFEEELADYRVVVAVSNLSPPRARLDRVPHPPPTADVLRDIYPWNFNHEK